MNILIILTCLIALETLTEGQKILIVGSGVGGSSTAHYLSSLFKNLDITIHEKENKVGGRASSKPSPLMNVTYEFGASFFIKSNKLLMNILDEYNLSYYKSTEFEIGARDQTIAVTNGEEILLKLGSHKIIDFIRLSWRYGFSFLGLNKKIKDMIAKFEKIYDKLGDFEEEPFENHQEMLKLIDNYDLVNKSFEEYLINEGYDKLYVNELLKSILVSIYNQENLNAFAGMISLAGIFNPAFNIRGGNNLITDKIVYENKKGNVRTFTSHRVLNISKMANGKFEVFVHNSKDLKVELYDLVVIAAPNYGGIVFDENLKKLDNSSDRKFKRTYVGYISGIFKAEKLKLSSEAELSKFVLFLNKEKTGLGEVKVLCRNCYKNNMNITKNIYKICMDFKPSVEFLSSYFDDPVELEYVDWDIAYPVLEPNNPENLPKLRIDEGIYYLNGIEHAASCMEIEIITAKNIVNLIAKYEGKSWEKESKFSKKSEPSPLNQDL